MRAVGIHPHCEYPHSAHRVQPLTCWRIAPHSGHPYGGPRVEATESSESTRTASMDLHLVFS